MNEEESYLFDLRGYLVVEGVLSHYDLQALNDLIDKLPCWEERSHSRHIHTGMDEAYVRRGNSDPCRGPVDFYAGLLFDWGEPFRGLVGHPRLLPYLTTIIGETFRLDHQYAIVMKRGEDITSTHELHSGATPYSPEAYYDFRDGRFCTNLIAVSFALTDAPRGTGGFCCIPGSHKSNLKLPARFQNIERPAPCLEQIPVKAGDVIIFTEAMTHGCLEWTAPYERRVLMFKYCPAYIQWEPADSSPSSQYSWSPEQRRILELPYASGRECVVQPHP